MQTILKAIHIFMLKGRRILCQSGNLQEFPNSKGEPVNSSANQGSDTFCPNEVGLTRDLFGTTPKKLKQLTYFL
jgi:hypothetical protein